jgi:hypothetical protein
VPAWAVKRVNAAKIDELGEMSRRMVRVGTETLADVLGPRGNDVKAAQPKRKSKTG